MSSSLNLLTNRLWNSPTLMTWISYSVKALSLFAVLPLIISKFKVEEVSLWYLFSSIMVLLGLADMGFRLTFSRLISYAFGGAEDIVIINQSNNNFNQQPNWGLIEKIFSEMKRIYRYLSLFLFVLLVTIGTLSLIRPIGLLDDKIDYWIAWIVIIVSSIFRFYGLIYQNYLEGLDKIALTRRLESVVSFFLIITSILVLVFGGGLLQLVIAFQFWGVLNVFFNLLLVKKVEEGRYNNFKDKPFDKELFRKIWKPSWRSGISGLMSNGLTQFSGILYAQIGSIELVAAYLLALRLVSQIKEVSMAPFYSKMPKMAILRAKNNLSELKKISQRGMFLSHMTFVIGVVVIGLFSSSLLELIKSDTDFISLDLWLLLSFAFLIHRYGAMHMQLYMTTNHVISHIADAISGTLFIVSTMFLINKIGLYSIPLGMLVGYLGFYSWYSAYYSLKSLGETFFKFELKSLFFPLILFLVFTALILYK